MRLDGLQRLIIHASSSLERQLWLFFIREHLECAAVLEIENKL